MKIKKNAQHNKIGDEGSMEIAEALKINNTLTILYLGVRFIYFWHNQSEKKV